MVIPGGISASGIGGRIYTGEVGLQKADLIEQGPSGGSFDVTNWQLVRTFVNANTTHTGTYGAISRRRVAYDFQFQCSVVFNYADPPEGLLYNDQTVAILLALGDVTQDPILAKAIQDGKIPEQRYYFAPSAILDRVVTVMSGDGRDVIRQELIGSGNSYMFALPDEAEACRIYMEYLASRGWAT